MDRSGVSGEGEGWGSEWERGERMVERVEEDPNKEVEWIERMRRREEHDMVKRGEGIR